MDSFLELAEKILNRSLMLGKSQIIEVSSQKIPSFAVSIGLALSAEAAKSRAISAASPNKVFGLFDRVKEIYQDYF
jgi:hypothetical protein